MHLEFCCRILGSDNIKVDTFLSWNYDGIVSGLCSVASFVINGVTDFVIIIMIQDMKELFQK